MPEPAAIPTTLAPWLAVRGGAAAVAFYTAAFGAVEVYRVESPGGGDGPVAVVSRLRLGDGTVPAEFWLSDEAPEHGNPSPATLGGTTVRLILTVADPDAWFARAVAAGATPVAPVTVEHGWRTGRVRDPFGHDWEIGRPV